MWTLKFKLHNKENFLNILARKYDLKIEGYPLNTFIKNNKFYVTVAGNIFGEENRKKLFFKDLKKVQFIKDLEIRDNFGIMTVEQPIQISKLYEPFFIYLEPISITKDFYQIYSIGSWKRENLSKILNLKMPDVKLELLSFKQEKINNISITSISPLLTPKQEEAFKLAYKNGYYNFPRSTELGLLSKLMKKSLSTYQAHLRKAEKKIMNFFFKRLV